MSCVNQKGETTQNWIPQISLVWPYTTTKMALESTVQLQQNDGNKTPEKPVDREKVKAYNDYNA